MYRLFLALAFHFIAATGLSQCLTDFRKLIPEPGIDYSLDFGKSVAMHDKYMAVGVPNSDSLARLSGIVYIYKKVNNEWLKIASVAPSDPLEGMQFGSDITISENYLFVSSRYNGGKVYVFKKGAIDWTSQTELGVFKTAGSGYFGINPYGNKSIAISEDEQTLAISDVYAPITPSNASPYYMGAVYVYHRLPFQDWNSPIAPTRIIAPRGDIADFGRAGVALNGNHLATGSPYTEDGGNLFVYHDPTGTFSNYNLQATLRPLNNQSYYLGAYNIVFTNDGLFSYASEASNNTSKPSLLFFEKGMLGGWSNASPTCSFSPLADDTNVKFGTTSITTNGIDLFVSAQSTFGDGYFNLIKKGVSGWCDPIYKNIDFALAPDHSNNNPYGIVSASNQQSDAVLGFVPIPSNKNATIALKTFSYQGGLWNSNLLYPTKKSTAGHRFGRTVIGYDNHLFVGSPNDGTNVPGVGAVYYYQKQGSLWNNKSKIVSPSTSTFDDEFGSALATNKNYLAVGASSYQGSNSAIGRVFIYKKPASGWEQAELVQEITLPDDQYVIYSYGDNLAMTDEWLIIPYVQNSPYRIMLAIYKFDGLQWNFFQITEAGFGNFFARFTTIAVSIENETLVAGNLIFEINEAGNWELKYTLSPSDPEPFQISSDFTQVITNGSFFGFSNSIKDNTIFIGAPQKDYQGVWDVGAVYVYTKKPNESWSSRTETAKIIPRVVLEGEIFGYSLQNSGNTLLVGAPGADYYKDGVTARNKPGRAYVFRSKDFYWQDIEPLIDITGDSFTKDYYGIDVYMDNSDFFIGAAIEDIETGQLSGSVYVTPSPPIIKLVPPVCSSESVIDLFGYPFGGIWSGPGIIDAAEGTFDPKIAGAGIHEFRYKTPSCTYDGILRIMVEDPPIITLINQEQLSVCVGESFSFTLGVTIQADVNYSWYFRTDDNQVFSPLNIISPTLTATNRGEYQLKAIRNNCVVYTPIITISNEELQIIIDSPIKACERNSTQIQLIANPVGGTWSGAGISNNHLVTSGLNAGIYKATYTFVSALGCTYTDMADVLILPAPTPVIERTHGNLCDEGLVTLKVHEPIPGNLYSWIFKNETDSYIVAGNTTTVDISKHGSYIVMSDNDLCKINSQPVIINDQLKVTIDPPENYIEVCSEDDLTITTSEPLQASYEWYFRSSILEPMQQVLSDENMVKVDASGYYQVHISKGVCNYESEFKQVVILPKDSIFVPNVFTPNGDGSNEIFKIEGTAADANLVVLNRYGSRMFEGSAIQGWTGDNATPGVYFWIVQYLTCKQEGKNLKGSVQLIR
jgi:gliding motility-associated-like protein